METESKGVELEHVLAHDVDMYFFETATHWDCLNESVLVFLFIKVKLNFFNYVCVLDSSIYPIVWGRIYQSQSGRGRILPHSYL